MKDIFSEIIASITGGFRGRDRQRWQSNTTATTLVAMATKVRSAIGYNAACMRHISQILASGKFFGAGPLNDASQTLPRPTLVAIATKFEAFGRKLAITRFA